MASLLLAFLRGPVTGFIHGDKDNPRSGPSKYYNHPLIFTKISGKDFPFMILQITFLYST